MAAKKKSRPMTPAEREAAIKRTEARKAAKREAQAARQRDNRDGAKEGLMTPQESAKSQRKAKRLGLPTTTKRKAFVPGAIALVNRRQGIYASFKPIGTDPKTRANREQAKAAISEIVAKAAA